jgi:hypothetical protein
LEDHEHATSASYNVTIRQPSGASAQPSTPHKNAVRRVEVFDSQLVAFEPEDGVLLGEIPIVDPPICWRAASYNDVPVGNLSPIRAAAGGRSERQKEARLRCRRDIIQENLRVKLGRRVSSHLESVCFPWFVEARFPSSTSQIRRDNAEVCEPGIP